MNTKEKEFENLKNLQKRNNSILVMAILMFAFTLLGIILTIAVPGLIGLILAWIILVAGIVLGIVQLVKVIILIVQWFQEENVSKQNEVFTKYTVLVILLIFFGWIPSLIIKILVKKDIESDYFNGVDVQTEEVERTENTNSSNTNESSIEEVMNKIEKSKELFDKQAITEEEYNEIKQKLLKEIMD